MSGSVWYEQVDTALYSLLGSITVKDENDNTVAVKVVVNPEEEIKDFPTIRIGHYDERYSPIRDGRERVIVSTDTTTGIATMEDPAKPYDLYYQIDLWAEYNIDINTMTMQLLTLIGEHYSLALVDTEGTSRYSEMDKVGFKKLDSTDEALKKFIFRRAYSYRIMVELDEVPSQSVKIVKEVVVEKEIDFKEE